MGVRSLVDKITGRKNAWWLRNIDAMFIDDGIGSMPVGYFRPSGVGQCMRENQYCYIGAIPPRQRNIYSMRHMKRGTEHHTFWERLFKEAGIPTVSGKEYPVGILEPLIFGESDWVISDENSENYLIEWKSTTSIDDPDWSQVIQWSLYAHLLNVNYDLEIKDGWLVKEHPTSLDLIPFPMKLEQEYINLVLARLIEVETFSRRGEMLPIDERCGKVTGFSRYCEAKELCSSDIGNSPWSNCQLIHLDHAYIEGRLSNVRR